MADAKTNTTPIDVHCNTLFEAMESFRDALAIISVAARDEETQHGAFCRALGKLLNDVYEDIDTLHFAMKGETA